MITIHVEEFLSALLLALILISINAPWWVWIIWFVATFFKIMIKLSRKGDNKQ